MNSIDFRSFLLRQPNFPEEMSTDRFYFDLANSLVKITEQNNLLSSWHESSIHRAALCMIGYLQDIIADAGIWRAFINHCRHLYNKTLPFFDVSDNYIDYELNPEDVRFLLWYSLAMNNEERRTLSPTDEEVFDCAKKWHEYLESVYDEAPVPDGYHLAHEVEIHAEEDSEQVMRLARWIAHHCYLMTPADSLSVANLIASRDTQAPDFSEKIAEEVNNLLTTSPIGPLALFLREWMYLIIEGRIPDKRGKVQSEPHKYFLPFLSANDNKPMKIFSSYEEMNNFLIQALGWAEGVEHLSQLKGARNFILLVNRQKGMLVAVDIAECIKSPGNTLYNEEIARRESFRLLTMRGVCPGDLLIYICSNGWLPDASFPESPSDTSIVEENWDFIARCYLENYYRED